MSNESQKNPSGLVVGIADFVDQTLLMLGDTPSFARLANLMQTTEIGRQIDFNAVGRCVNVRMTLVFDAAGDLRYAGNRLEWRISPREAKQFARQLQVLADSTNIAGHQYLDPASNQAQLQIVASKGEYNPLKIFEKSNDA